MDPSVPGAFAQQRRCWCPSPLGHPCVPRWQLDCKPFIQNGFRVAFTKRQCLYSVFLPILGLAEWHNETINIWTHLVPGLVAAYLTWSQMQTLTDGTDVSMLLFYLASAFMFLASATYHTFNDLSPRATVLLLRVDLFGIATMISGSYVPAVFMGFHCLPTWRWIWLGLAACLLLLGALVAFDFVADDMKTSCLCLLVGVGVVPTMHWAFIMPYDELLMLWRGVVGMFLMYSLGAVLFVSRWPERTFPGKTCVFGCSHQWWHLFVLLAAGVWWWNCEVQRAHFREKQLTVQVCEAM